MEIVGNKVAATKKHYGLKKKKFEEKLKMNKCDASM